MYMQCGQPIDLFYVCICLAAAAGTSLLLLLCLSQGTMLSVQDPLGISCLALCKHNTIACVDIQAHIIYDESCKSRSLLAC